MPSSYAFLQSNSSSSSSENDDSKSDQSSSDDDDYNDVKFQSSKKRTIQNDNDMLEQPSDSDDDDDDENDSYVQANDSDDNDLPLPSTIPESYLLPRQSTIYADEWRTKLQIDENKSQTDFKRNEILYVDSNPPSPLSPERSQSADLVDKKYHQSRNYQTFMQSDFTTASAQELQTVPKLEPMSITINKTEEKRRPISKIPVRTNSSSQSRSRSPPSKLSKIPVPLPTTSKGAFRFFTADERPRPPVKTEPSKIPKSSTKQMSPFTPITPAKTGLFMKKSSLSSAGNTPSAKSHRIQLPSTDDEDDDEHDTSNLKEEDLKIKLKEQKRHGRKTGELLEKLHENYEELLEKYAQAENTIDQLRFQPKLFGENTPTSTASEGAIHFIHQPRVNVATIHSNGIYHTTSTTPVSSIRQVPSTTTTTTPVLKSNSPANSCAIESVFFDEPIAQKIIVQELSTPETLKLDLLIQTKTLSEKMKSFITLMEANQLSLAEQQQVYESIKDDYEKLLKTLEEKKRRNDLSDLDFDGDLNQELETMKQLLKEIVKRITDNLLGKSSQNSDNGRQNISVHNESHSSQLSPRSSLINHNELMDQYQKLLNAVNTETKQTKPKQTLSRQSSHSDISEHKSQKPYVYVSGNSDDEQQSPTPISSIKRIDSTPFNIDRIPSQLNKHHQQINQEQTHIHGLTSSTKKKKSTKKNEHQDYDNLDNITKTKRKTKLEYKPSNNRYQAEKKPSPPTRYSTSSLRTRTSDYDSGIGTNNTTKLSRDSKLNTSTMDESHYQSLDDDRRRYTDEEQESMSTVSSSSSSRSSASGATNSPNLYSKSTKRFHSTSNLQSRRKPSGHSDVYQSDIETHLTGSFDPLPPPPSFSSSPVKKTRQRHHHSWQPKRSHSSHSFHRSQSIETLDQSNLLDSSSHSMNNRNYQTGFIYRRKQPNETMYKSSFYVDQPHTHQRTKKILNNNNNLFFDPQSGMIYRYIPNQTPTVSTSKELYQCKECESITNYHHRHHNQRTIPTDIDDPGYESGNKRIDQYRRCKKQLPVSESESDDVTHVDLSVLNEAYERARKVQYRSQNLSRHIRRQLRLVLTTI